MRSPCGTWLCPACGPEHAAVVAAQVGDAARAAPVYAAELGPGDWKAATRMARRLEVGYLSVGRWHGGALLVAHAQLAGRDRSWSLRQVDLDELPRMILDLLAGRRVRRVSWAGDWQPEAKRPRLVTDKVIDSIACGRARPQAILARSGVVAGDRATVPPKEAAAAIRAAAEAAAFWTPPR